MGISKYLVGYAIIKIEGESLEAFTNLAMERNVPIWDLMPIDKNFWQGKVPLKALAGLRHISHVSGVYFTVSKKIGVSQWWRKLTYHPVAATVIILVLCLLVIYTQSVLGVRITVDGDLSHQEKTAILQTAADYGIDVGLWQRNLPWDKASHGILTTYPNLAWVGFSRDGVILTVKVILKDEENRNNAIYGDVVAKKDGVIRELLVLQGQGRVPINTPVKKGEVIIGGEILHLDEEGNPTADNTVVHAKGIVFGSAWYIGEAYVNINEVKPKPTGKKCDKLTVKWRNTEYLVWGNNNHGFKDFTAVKHVVLPGMNLEVTIDKVREVRPQYLQKSKKQAMAEAEKKGYQKAILAVGVKAKIVDKKVEHLAIPNNNEIVGVRVTLETRENLGVFQGFESNF